jgi:hypothetical protein
LIEDGPTYDEVKNQQRPEHEARERLEHLLADGAAAGSVHYLKHQVIERAPEMIGNLVGSVAVEQILGKLGLAYTYIDTAIEVTEKAYDVAVRQPMERGAALSAARERDQQNLSLILLLNYADPSALPSGYLPTEMSRVAGARWREHLNQNVAFQRLTPMLARLAENDPEATLAMRSMLSAAREGTAAAYQNAIADQATLTALLSTSRDFRLRFELDAAFRIGIKAVMWQAATHTDEYQQGIALNGPHRTTTGRM